MSDRRRPGGISKIRPAPTMRPRPGGTTHSTSGMVPNGNHPVSRPYPAPRPQHPRFRPTHYRPMFYQPSSPTILTVPVPAPVYVTCPVGFSYDERYETCVKFAEPIVQTR